MMVVIFWVISQLSEPPKPHSSTLTETYTQDVTSALLKTIFLQPELGYSQWVTDVQPASCHSILVKTLQKKDYQHFQFTDEETETQRQNLTGQIHFSHAAVPMIDRGYVPRGRHPVGA